MNSKNPALPEDDAKQIVQRYEAFLSRDDVSGYFDVEEMEKIVDYYLRRGRTRESSHALEFGFKLHPNSLTLFTKRAKIYLAIGETSKAYRILNSLGDSGDYELNLLKIDALARMEKELEAHALCQKLIALETDEKDQVCLDVAYIWLALFNTDAAFIYLKMGAGFNPKNDSVLFELAFCYEQLQHNDKALTVYNKIIKLDPYAAEAWFNMGQLYFSMQQLPEALSAYEYAQAIQPEDSLICLQKGHTHFQLQQYKEALEEYFLYEQMVENGQTNLFIAESYERLEQYTEAILYYEKVLAEEEDHVDACTGVAICLLEQKLYSESIPYIERAIILNENAPEVWVYLAEALIGTDEVDAALLAYLKSLELEETQPETLVAVANIFLERMEFTLALQYYRKAYDFDTENVVENIHLFLAICYFKTDNTKNAYEHLKLALAKNMDAFDLFFEVCPEAADMFTF